MPITAKLSKQFYDKFGNAVVDELVNWFNAVDATYKQELRDLNELNFGVHGHRIHAQDPGDPSRWRSPRSSRRLRKWSPRVLNSRR